MGLFLYISLLLIPSLFAIEMAENVMYDTSDWLRTPIGLTHPSCVHHVPSGSHAKREQTNVGRLRVYAPDGSTRDIPRCQYPITWPQTQNSNVARQSFAPGWQVWTTFESSSPKGFTEFLGYFTIPDVPQSADDQTLFMFTGLQNENWVPGPNSPPAPNDFEIIQPVLQYGYSAGGGGDYWTLASWYVTVYDGFLISDLITVNAGDTIFGNMTLVAEDSWFISGVLKSNGQATSLTADKSNLKVNPWAYCTLEVYGDSGDCGEYPDNPQVYSGLKIYDGGAKVTPKWQVNVTPSPICGESITVENPTHVTIHFGSNK